MYIPVHSSNGGVPRIATPFPIMLTIFDKNDNFFAILRSSTTPLGIEKVQTWFATWFENVLNPLLSSVA